MSTTNRSETSQSRSLPSFNISVSVKRNSACDANLTMTCRFQHLRRNILSHNVISCYDHALPIRFVSGPAICSKSLGTAFDECQPGALHPLGYLRLECSGWICLIVSIGAEDQGQLGSVVCTFPWKARDVAEVAIIQVAVGWNAEIVSKTIRQVLAYIHPIVDRYAYSVS